ncbi:MAG TPA: hypothetical protein VGR70_04915, partial [Stellaceae bacterium]|nr:hypothetical protein [Stellaceae bacterium]
MPPYSAAFPVGTPVQVATRSMLAEFQRDWKLHHPLQLEQLDCAGRVSVVKAVGYYHGGDVLYWLEDVPGTWHESCL